MHKILVIDDDLDILNVVKFLFKKEGYQVFTRSSGEDFIDTVTKLQPDLILLDIQLGLYDGRTLCKELKSIEELQRVKVVLFSANPVYAGNVSKYHCDEFIEKPFETKQLLRTIGDLVN